MLKVFRLLATAAAALVLFAPSLRAADKGAARRLFVEGEALYRRGEFKDAMRSANAALEADSRNGDAYELRARLWHAAGDSTRQKADATKALELLGVGTGALAVDELVAQGGAQLLLGRVDKALESFNAALKADQKTPAAFYARSRVWREKGDMAKALADLDDALKREPKTALWLYSRGRAYYDKGDDAKAVLDLTAALRANKNFTLAFALVGSAMARQGDFKRAAKAYDRAISIDPEYSYAYLGRAALKLRQGNEPGALSDFEEAVRADAQDYAPYYNRGELHWRGGRREQALSDYHNAMTSQKLTPEAALAIGDRYLSLQLWKDAIAAYGRAHDLGAAVPALVRRARVYESEKDPKRALADLDEAVKREPENAAVLAARGTLLARMGQDKPAMDDLNRAVRLAPADTEILVARASFYARVEKPTLALEDFTKAIDADPKLAEAYNGRGALYANALKEPEKALRDVMKAVELKPREPGYHYNLGSLRLRSRLYFKAIDSFNTALALKGPAARILERRADAEFQLGDHSGAMRDIEAALEKDPRNAGIYDTLGNIRLRARDYEQAVRDLSQALQLDDKLASGYQHRGLAYGSLNQLKAAQADFKKALELEPRSKDTWTYLCQAQRLAHNPREALKSCERAIELDSQHGPAYLQRALAKFDLKRYPRAIEDIDTAWALGTRRAEGLIAKSIAHAAARQYKEAHRTYLQAVGMDPYVRSPYIGFAAGHPEGNDYLSAIVDLDGQMMKDLGDPYVFILRADSLHNSEQFDKAVLEYTKAMEIDGSVADAYVGRGVALTAQDALEAAQQDFVRALELEPNDSNARVKLAIVLTMRRNYKAAVGELGKALQADPKNAEAYLRAGNVHYFLKEYPKALENYSLAVKTDPLDPNALNGLGLGYFALKRQDEALESFSRAIAVNSLVDRYYRNRASVWTASQKFGNAAGDFKTASMVNTDPTVIDEYKRLIEESETRSAKGKSS
ncbi:MAG: tetratricopeptide repeat protein [Elusimicrobia bacterium]|nr:tetratricopeptide repeat protein [Elusimicrobiota bacterium]